MVMSPPNQHQQEQHEGTKTESVRSTAVAPAQKEVRFSTADNVEREVERLDQIVTVEGGDDDRDIDDVFASAVSCTSSGTVAVPTTTSRRHLWYSRDELMIMRNDLQFVLDNGHAIAKRRRKERQRLKERREAANALVVVHTADAASGTPSSLGQPHLQGDERTSSSSATSPKSPQSPSSVMLLGVCGLNYGYFGDDDEYDDDDGNYTKTYERNYGCGGVVRSSRELDNRNETATRLLEEYSMLIYYFPLASYNRERHNRSVLDWQKTCRQNGDHENLEEEIRLLSERMTHLSKEGSLDAARRLNHMLRRNSSSSDSTAAIEDDNFDQEGTQVEEDIVQPIVASSTSGDDAITEMPCFPAYSHARQQQQQQAKLRTSPPQNQNTNQEDIATTAYIASSSEDTSYLGHCFLCASPSEHFATTSQTQKHQNKNTIMGETKGPCDVMLDYYAEHVHEYIRDPNRMMERATALLCCTTTTAAKS